MQWMVLQSELEERFSDSFIKINQFRIWSIIYKCQFLCGIYKVSAWAFDLYEQVLQDSKL